MKRILKAWIHQEIEFDHQKELDDYKSKNPYVQVIETKASDGKRVIAVVKNLTITAQWNKKGGT